MIFLLSGLLYTLSAVGMFMAAGLKRTSSDFFVSASITESAANTFTTQEITLPLNSLDREVFVITGIILDPGTPNSIALTQTTSNVTLSRQLPTAIEGIAEFNTIALSAESINGGVGEFDYFSKTYGNQITDTGADYIDVVATPNMFLAVLGANNVNPMVSEVRVFGYRAKAEVSVYSALIASELNA